MNFVDLQKYQVMAGIIEKLTPKPRFLTQTFFSHVKTYAVDKIYFDVKDELKTRVIPYVSKMDSGSFSYNDSYKTKELTPGYLTHKRIITPDEILKVGIGETPNDKPNYKKRENRVIIETISNLKDLIENTIEYTISELLFKGTVKLAPDEEGNDTLTYWNQSDKPYTELNKKWTEADADPLQDINTVYSKAISNSNVMYDILLMNQNTYNLFYSKLDKKEFDIKDINNGFIDPKKWKNQVRSYGMLKHTGLEIIVYNGQYYDAATNKNKPFIPDNCVLLANSFAETQLAFGPISYNFKDESHFFEGRFGSYVRKPDGPQVITEVNFLSRPLPIVHNPHDFHVIKVKD